MYDLNHECAITRTPTSEHVATAIVYHRIKQGSFPSLCIGENCGTDLEFAIIYEQGRDRRTREYYGLGEYITVNENASDNAKKMCL